MKNENQQTMPPKNDSNLTLIETNDGDESDNEYSLIVNREEKEAAQSDAPDLDSFPIFKFIGARVEDVREGFNAIKTSTPAVEFLNMFTAAKQKITQVFSEEEEQQQSATQRPSNS